jgi:hypothetical protein
VIAPTVTLEQRALDRYLKTLAKNEGKPLHTRAQRTINASTKRRIVPALKANAPVGPKRRRSSGPIKIRAKTRKTMRGSASAKLLRRRGGEQIRPTWAGYKAFHARWYLAGTSAHSIATRGLTGPFRSGTRFGRWTTPGSSNFGTSNWRSAYAHFPDGEVRPLWGIRVSGVSPHDTVARTWAGTRGAVTNDVKRDVFAVR